MARNSVKVINAALDEVKIDQVGSQIVLRGVLDNDSLDLLQVSEYQREILPQSKIMDLIGAMKTGRVPDIELGMRGGIIAKRTVSITCRIRFTSSTDSSG